MKKVKTGREMVGLLGVALATTKEEFITIQKKLTFDAFSDLIMFTPVDTGLARSNWRVAVNNAPESSPYAPKGKATAPRPRYEAPSIQFGDSSIVYNNTVYIGELEQGTSKQAPQGMIEPTFYRVTYQTARLLKALSRRKLNV